MSVGLVGLFALLAALFGPSPQPQPTERVLNVGWAHQAHNLSCEAAALKMALSYYGIDTDELRLISFMSRDSRPAGSTHQVTSCGGATRRPASWATPTAASSATRATAFTTSRWR